MCRTDPSVMFSISMSAAILLIVSWCLFGEVYYGIVSMIVLHTVYHLVPTFKEEVGEQGLGVKNPCFSVGPLTLRWSSVSIIGYTVRCNHRQPKLCGSSLDFEFIRECMKINKIRLKIHLKFQFCTQIEIKNDLPCVCVLLFTVSSPLEPFGRQFINV